MFGTFRLDYIVYICTTHTSDRREQGNIGHHNGVHPMYILLTEEERNRKYGRGGRFFWSATVIITVNLRRFGLFKNGEQILTIFNEADNAIADRRTAR